MLEHIKHLNYTPDTVDDHICAGLLSSFRKDIYTSIGQLLEADQRFALHSDCIIEKLKSFAVDNPYLAKFVYTEDKTMSKLRRQRALSDLVTTIEQKYELAEEICVPDQMFGDWFDETVGEDSESVSNNSSGTEAEQDIETLKEEYCQRIYVIEKKAIDMKVYKVDVNPKNVDVTNFDCNKFLMELSEEFVINLKDEFVSAMKKPTVKSTRCMANIIRNGRYFEYLLKLWVLSELKITNVQRMTERSLFITFLTNLYTNILECDVWSDHIY